VSPLQIYTSHFTPTSEYNSVRSYFVYSEINEPFSCVVEISTICGKVFRQYVRFTLLTYSTVSPNSSIIRTHESDHLHQSVLRNASSHKLHCYGTSFLSKLMENYVLKVRKLYDHIPPVMARRIRNFSF
jgi:hypothetical protein